MQRIKALFLFWLSWLTLAGCSTVITCPPAQNPLSVALVDHGRHASLIVYQGENKMTRYGYGDWTYYALPRKGVEPGAKALFWPTQAALGRKPLEGPLEKSNIRKKLFISVEEILVFKAEAAKVEELEKRFEKIFKKNRESLHYNNDYDLEFVPYPETYWAFNNSNQKIASWIEQMGCDAKGLSIFSNWSLKNRSGKNNIAE